MLPDGTYSCTMGNDMGNGNCGKCGEYSVENCQNAVITGNGEIPSKPETYSWARQWAVAAKNVSCCKTKHHNDPSTGRATTAYCGPLTDTGIHHAVCDAYNKAKDTIGCGQFAAADHVDKRSNHHRAVGGRSTSSNAPAFNIVELRTQWFQEQLAFIEQHPLQTILYIVAFVIFMIGLYVVVKWIKKTAIQCWKERQKRAKLKARGQKTNPGDDGEFRV